MAGSYRPGPITPRFETSRIPSRTPGPLGINDQADPDITTLLGDTPGSIGLLDWADPTLPQMCPTYPYAELMCKNSDGATLSIGFDFETATPVVAVTAPQTIALDQAQEMALKISTYFEGGKSMNYQALADDFDGEGTSFGLIQWNFGSNTLGPLLKKMLDKDSKAFADCFGSDAAYDTLKSALVDGKKSDQLKWARDLIKNKRSAWESAFNKIGANNTFNKIQKEQALELYHPLAVAVIKNIRIITSTLFVNVEVKSYCAVYDLCVQQKNGIDDAMPEIKKRVTDEKPVTQLELMKIVVTEKARKAKNKWVSDCLSRRMGILTGASYRSKEHDVTVERKNPQLSLMGDSGRKHVSGL